MDSAVVAPFFGPDIDRYDGGQSDDCAGGKVKVAADQHDSHTQADQTDNGYLAQHVQDVAGCDEFGFQQGDADHQNGENHPDRLAG